MPSGFSSTRRVSGVTSSLRAEVGRGRAEQIRRRRQIEHAHHRLPVLERGLQRPDSHPAWSHPSPAYDRRLEKRAQTSGLSGLPLVENSMQDVLDQLDEIVRAHLAARDGDDAAIRRQAVVAVQFVERREQLALAPDRRGRRTRPCRTVRKSGGYAGYSASAFPCVSLRRFLPGTSVPHRPLEFSKFQRRSRSRGQTDPRGSGALSLINHLAMRTITATSQQPQINMPDRDKKHSFASPLWGSAVAHA